MRNVRSVYLYIMKNMFSSYQTKLIPICIRCIFSICTYIYMRATTFIYSFHVLRMYIVQYVQSILLFWTRMKSMRILGRDNVVAHQTHFKPSNLTIFSSMDLKIHLTQRKWSATRQFLQHLQNTHKINSKIIVITLMFRFCL